jgi:hypothetical protein
MGKTNLVVSHVKRPGGAVIPKEGRTTQHTGWSLTTKGRLSKHIDGDQGQGILGELKTRR